MEFGVLCGIRNQLTDISNQLRLKNQLEIIRMRYELGMITQAQADAAMCDAVDNADRVDTENANLA